LQRGAAVDCASLPHPSNAFLASADSPFLSCRRSRTVHLPLTARAHQQAAALKSGPSSSAALVGAPPDAAIPYAPKGSKVHLVDGIVLPPGLFKIH
jgi:hypothetical protein